MDLFRGCTKKIVAEVPAAKAIEIATPAPAAVVDVKVEEKVEEKKGVSEEEVTVEKIEEPSPLDDMDEMTKTMFKEGRDLHVGLMKDIRAFIDKVNEDYKTQIKMIDKLNKRKNDYVTGVCQFTMNMIYEINYLERFLDEGI